MVGCTVRGCKSRSEQNISGLTFHSYPIDPKLRKKWIDATGRKDWDPTKYSKICCYHFDARHVIKKTKITFIRHGAVPVLMLGRKLISQNNKRVQDVYSKQNNVKIALVQNTQDVDLYNKYNTQLLENTLYIEDNKDDIELLDNTEDIDIDDNSYNTQSLEHIHDIDIEDNKDNIQLLYNIEDNKDNISFKSVRDKNLTQDEDEKDYTSFTVIGTHSAVNKRPSDDCDDRSDTLSAKLDDEKSIPRLGSVLANSELLLPKIYKLQRKLQIKNELHTQQRKRVRALQEKIKRLQKKNVMLSQTIKELENVAEIRTGAARERDMNILKKRNLQLQEKNISLVEIINKLKSQDSTSKCKTCGS